LVPTKNVRAFQTENPSVAVDGVFLKLVSVEELDEVRRRLQIPLGTDLKYQQSRYQANEETMKGKATFEWRNGNKYWIEPKPLQQAFVTGTLRKQARYRLGLYSRSIGLFK
jgi:hypothetical protein